MRTYYSQATKKQTSQKLQLKDSVCACVYSQLFLLSCRLWTLAGNRTSKRQVCGTVQGYFSSCKQGLWKYREHTALTLIEVSGWKLQLSPAQTRDMHNYVCRVKHITVTDSWQTEQNKGYLGEGNSYPRKQWPSCCQILKQTFCC